MAIARRELTLEEFLALPDEKPALEYVDGMVTQKVPPQYEHSALQTGLVFLLHRQAAFDRVARAFTELRTTYSGRSYVPDVCGYRRERLPRRTRGRRIGELRTPPDLAIEIISPGQSRTRLAEQCRWYVAHGVLVALLVDDRDETIREFRPNRPVAVRRRGDTINLAEIAPGLHLAVDEVFAALDGD